MCVCERERVEVILLRSLVTRGCPGQGLHVTVSQGLDADPAARFPPPPPARHAYIQTRLAPPRDGFGSLLRREEHGPIQTLRRHIPVGTNPQRRSPAIGRHTRHAWTEALGITGKRSQRVVWRRGCEGNELSRPDWARHSIEGSTSAHPIALCSRGYRQHDAQLN